MPRYCLAKAISSFLSMPGVVFTGLLNVADDPFSCGCEEKVSRRRRARKGTLFNIGRRNDAAKILNLLIMNVRRCLTESPHSHPNPLIHGTPEIKSPAGL